MMKMDGDMDLRSRMMRSVDTDASVFRNVLFYCSLILLLPLLAFFGTKSLVFEIMLGQQSTIGTNIVAAVVAVITLHLALGLFIYKAYFDEEKTRKND